MATCAAAAETLAATPCLASGEWGSEGRRGSDDSARLAMVATERENEPAPMVDRGLTSMRRAVRVHDREERDEEAIAKPSPGHLIVDDG